MSKPTTERKTAKTFTKQVHFLTSSCGRTVSRENDENCWATRNFFLPKFCQKNFPCENQGQCKCDGLRACFETCFFAQPNTKKMQKQNKGKKQFFEHYEKQFGAARWKALVLAMEKPKQHCCLVNKFCDAELALPQDAQPVSFLNSKCFVANLFEAPTKTNVMNYYLLDAASLLAVEALQLQPNDKVLDLCSAPGGKAIAILQQLSGLGSLHCNEMDGTRRKRLQQVIIDYCPFALANRIKITGLDASKTALMFEKQVYDKVLVDAPCSSDRHVIQSNEELAKWNPSITKQMHDRQYALCMTALESCKFDGIIVYATCSISDMENDKVVERVFQNKRKLGCTIVSHERTEFAKIAEKTKYGWIVLPDKNSWGPIYFAILKRVTVEEPKQESDDDDDDEEDDKEEAQ